MRFINIVLILFCVICSSCVEDSGVDDVVRMNGSSEEKLDTRSVQDSLSFELLPDPYSLINMQSVYDEYLGVGEVELSPTHLYVRFLPEDSEQLDLLLDIEELDLSPVPMDIDPADEESYTQMIEASEDYCWLYDAVEVDFEFPEGINYEIIRPCYIPRDGESITLTRESSVDVETEAYSRLGYDVACDNSISPLSKQNPTGVLTVLDDSYKDGAKHPVPLVGVKVVCSTFCKKGSDYTDSDGKYTINKTFTGTPKYKIVFKNENGFTIWGNWGFLAPAQKSYKNQSPLGFSMEFTPDNMCWQWCVVNNAANEYWLSNKNGPILLPPSNLKIWVWKGYSRSSAPMLRRIKSYIQTTWGDNFIERFLNILYGDLVTINVLSFSLLLPDVFIGTKELEYYEIYQSVNHELSHVSHFMQVGDDYWARYVAYIMSYGNSTSSYGDGTGVDSELCGIGEMWGYAMGSWYNYEKYDFPNELNYPGGFIAGWIKPHIFWDLMRIVGLSKEMIFLALTSDVDTYGKLLAKLRSLYPDYEEMILAVFAMYRMEETICRSSELKSISGVGFDKPYIKYGYAVDATNFEVVNNARLVIAFEDKVTLSEFYIAPNSMLELKDIY